VRTTGSGLSPAGVCERCCFAFISKNASWGTQI
jgi:hypothetical protein